LLEPLVDLRVDARDEDGGDRVDGAEVDAGLSGLLKSIDVGLGDRTVAIEREDERDVDGDAGGDRLGDRRQALRRRRDLDEGVRTIDDLPQVLRLFDRRVRLPREARV